VWSKILSYTSNYISVIYFISDYCMWLLLLTKSQRRLNLINRLFYFVRIISKIFQILSKDKIKGGDRLSELGITPRESLDLHEIIVFKTLCATKATTMNLLAKDKELKELLQADANAAKEHIKELRDLLKTSPFLKENN